MLIILKDLSKQLNSWVSKKNYTSIFILVDENTKRDCFPILNSTFEHQIIEIKSGEIHKNLETCQFIWKSLLEKIADRNSLLVNLGGGVICDMGAFCASTYKRGIDFINIPTTLLSQVDASVGSKTGIDFLGQKNMIGLFSEAKEVFIDAIFLSTLSQREILSGFAEVLKHGLIQNKKYFNDCIKSFKNQTINWQNVIEKSIAIKSKIVALDPKEKNLRKILNFGHTIGHAVETYSLKNHKNPILHGEAVVLGIIAELYLSYIKGFMSILEINKIIVKILSIYDFQKIELFDITAIQKYVLNDKKNQSKIVKCVLLKDIGEAHFNIEISTKEIEDALIFMLKKVK